MDRPAEPGESMLRSYLADRDEPCPGCGYNLRGLMSVRCPECNQELQLRIGLVEPRMRLFLVAVIGASVGLGFNALLLFYIVWRVVADGHLRNFFFAYFLWHQLVGAAIHGACVLALLRFGPRIRRLPQAPRTAIAAAMWGLSLLNAAIFAAAID